MIYKKRQTKGVTLIEIVVASVLLALIMGGLANIFFAAKTWLAHGRYKMTGSELGKVFLEPIAVDVKQSDWDSTAGDYISGNELSLGTRVGAVESPDGVKSYTPTYTISTVPAPGVGQTSPPQMRKIKVDITWAED